MTRTELLALMAAIVYADGKNGPDDALDDAEIILEHAEARAAETP